MPEIPMAKANLTRNELMHAEDLLREGKPVAAYEHVQKARQALEEGLDAE